MSGFVSLKVLLDRLLRNPMMSGVSFEKAVDDCVDFLEILKIPVTYVDKLFEGKVCDYRLELPCDIGYVKQVLINGIPVREATDTFHNHYHCMAIDNQPYMYRSKDLAMTMQDGYIFTSLKDCDISIAYKGIKTDDMGFPMIPDHRAFINGLEKYIEMKYLRVQWQNGRVTDKVYEDSCREYSWAVGQCETALRSLDLPKVESLMNMWQSLLQNNNHFAHRFANLGHKELFRR